MSKTNTQAQATLEAQYQVNAKANNDPRTPNPNTQAGVIANAGGAEVAEGGKKRKFDGTDEPARAYTHVGINPSTALLTAKQRINHAGRVLTTFQCLNCGRANSQVTEDFASSFTCVYCSAGNDLQT